MKRLGQGLMGLAFAALMILSFHTLVTHPQSEEDVPLPLPVQAVMRATSEAVPSEDLIGQSVPETASRRLLPDVASAEPLPVSLPVCDGNGIPIVGRSYVRTVYTACRLEDTSG